MLPDRKSRLAEEAAFLASFCLGRSEGDEEEEEFLLCLLGQNEKSSLVVLLPRLSPHTPIPATTTGHLRVRTLEGLHGPEHSWRSRGTCPTAAAAASFRLSPTRLFTGPLKSWRSIA